MSKRIVIGYVASYYGFHKVAGFAKVSACLVPNFLSMGAGVAGKKRFCERRVQGFTTDQVAWAVILLGAVTISLIMKFPQSVLYRFPELIAWVAEDANTRLVLGV